ncbi:MAG: IgA Peptidase M64, partial [Tannerellaceae bacterium]|nr:IgA Peptidase M64 [Tannerellaceae bacterium]
MKNRFSFLLLSILFTAGAFAQKPFDTYFENKSLRVDFTLNGNSSAQAAAIRQLREEPVWSGPVKNRIDRFDYGGYYVHVYDKATNELIYSRGFNTLFEEWRTTEQALHETQSWTNSISIPFPRKPIVLQLSARNKNDMQFHSLLKMDIDPASIFIDRGSLRNNRVAQIQYKGAPADKADLVFLAEGYTAAEQDKFEKDAKRFAELLFLTAPFADHREDFNVWAVCLVSEETGTDVSGEGVFRNTALNSGYYTFGIDRYLTTPDMESIRDAVWNVACDAIFILVNDEAYGGGGMYNFYAIGTSDNIRTPSVFVHELGHSFAGLGDEYFSSEVAYNDFYNLEAEPWEPNLTTLTDFNKKWKDLLPATTPVPTPLEEKYINGIGVFEGGGYLSKGIYRPMVHCMMRDYAPFCPVCSRSIVRMIDFLCDREEKKKNLPEHVILIGFDGWSAHSLNTGADMPAVRELMAGGA